MKVCFSSIFIALDAVRIDENDLDQNVHRDNILRCRDNIALWCAVLLRKCEPQIAATNIDLVAVGARTGGLEFTKAGLDPTMAVKPFIIMKFKVALSSLEKKSGQG